MSGVAESQTESRKRKAEEEEHPWVSVEDRYEHERARKRRRIDPEMREFVVQDQEVVEESDWSESEESEGVSERSGFEVEVRQRLGTIEQRLGTIEELLITISARLLMERKNMAGVVAWLGH